MNPMKTLCACNHFNVKSRPILLALALALLSFPTIRVFGSEDESKDYTEFRGLELMIPYQGNYYPLLGISENSAEIRVDRQIELVPFDQIKGYRTRQPTLIRAPRATIANLVADGAYTTANDPERQWNAERLAMMEERQDAEDRAEGAGVETMGNTAVATYQGDLALIGQAGDMDDNRAYDEKIQEELDQKLFDAIHVEFEVSSPKPINHPYVILVADFRGKKDKPGTFSRWIKIKQLGRVDGAPQKVTVQEGGFPPGFVLDKVQVHLYDNGREIATNVSEGRTDMTKGEVFEYLDRQYLAEHQGLTLGPVAIRGSSQARLGNELGAEGLNRKFEIKVGRDGKVLDYTPDEPDATGIPDAVKSFFDDLRFYPALDKGVPVEGKADASVADLSG
jgi:hypothetical protein